MSKDKLDMNMGLSQISAEFVSMIIKKKILKIIKLLGEEKDTNRIVKTIIKYSKFKENYFST